MLASLRTPIDTMMAKFSFEREISGASRNRPILDAQPRPQTTKGTAGQMELFFFHGDSVSNDVCLRLFSKTSTTFCETLS